MALYTTLIRAHHYVETSGGYMLLHMLKNANVQLPDKRTILLKCTNDAKSISENVLKDFVTLLKF
jgi:hypothetical protein